MKTLLGTEQFFIFFSFDFWPNMEIFIPALPNFYLDLIVSPLLSLLPESDFNPTLRWCIYTAELPVIWNFCNEMLCRERGTAGNTSDLWL
jgi:hypothetical protein